MERNRLGQTLAIGLAVIAVFFALSSLSMPVADRRLETWISVSVAVLMAAQAAIYWFGERIRSRIGMAGYLAIQAPIVFLVGLSGSLFPVGFGLYVALTAETVAVAAPRWGTVPISIVAIVVFGINAIVTSNLYFGATAALMLAVTAFIAQAIAALVRRNTPALAAAGPAISAAPPSAAPPSNGWNLTPREEEVLRALATGSRSSEIATRLGIAERTVKAHLASIYQKLGVESRTEAVMKVFGGSRQASS